jgi:adenosylcobyric acid synthase
MLGARIEDGVESGEDAAAGLGLLSVETVFEEEKILARPEGWALHFGKPRSRGMRSVMAASIASEASRSSR